MKNVLAEVGRSGDKVEIFFRYDPDNVKAIKQVPGAKFVPKDKGGPHWEVNLEITIMRRLREEFGQFLVLGEALKEWGREAVARERNLHALGSTDDVPIEDLQIGTKLPKLAEWFRPYQRADVKFLAATSALNLNQPGLGKTTEIIGAIFEADLEHGPHLVVAPKTSLNTVWRMEIERWTEDLEKPHEVITYHGDMTKAERQAALDEFAACIEDEWPVWFVTNPDTIRAGNQPKIEWATFTIDEYHKTGLTNATGSTDRKKGTQFSHAVRDIKSERRYAITGTPMGGKPIKLWGALWFLYPGQFKSKWHWADTWLEVQSNGFGKEIGSIKQGREDEFYAALAPFAIRRLKSEVLPQLPAKQYVDVWCDMTTKQAKQYRDMAEDSELMIEEESMNALGILSEYTRLKQFANAYVDQIDGKMGRCPRCSGTGEKERENQETGEMEKIPCPRCLGKGETILYKLIPSEESGKLPALWERLNEVGIDVGDDDSGDACAVISTQFKGMAEMVHGWLVKKGIKAELITGDVKEEERVRIQQAFQAGGPAAPRVVVMVTTAGGVAITLDRADTVHILDETWNPDDQEQLEDRVHRASRMHQVTCYYYRSKGTVEQGIYELNVEKSAINREILDIRRQGFRATMAEKS